MPLEVTVRGILSLLEPANPRTVAVVGCGKNTGKTTTLNALLQGCSDRGERVGLLSIGIDGEESDFWLGVPKPRILAPSGTLLATAEEALGAGTAKTRLLEGVGAVTLLGELVLAEVVEGGTVLLAGVRTRRDMVEAVTRLRALGADRVLLDGAWQRTMAADPRIAEGVILATGAVLGRTCQEVAAKTRETTSRLTLPVAESDSLRVAFQETDRKGTVTVFGAEASPGGAGDPRRVLLVPGALTPGRLHDLLHETSGPTDLLVADPTRVFLEPADFARLQRRGVRLHVAQRAPLLGVTVNPYSVLGWKLAREELLEAVARAVDPIPTLMLDLSPRNGA